MLTDNRTRIAILALAHFTVDFYGGLCVPLPEPTLVRHLSTNLLPVMILISGAAILINGIQPLAGVLLPKRDIPAILALSPVLAALVACIGLTTNYWTVGALLIVSGIGIGILHPEAVLAVQGLAGKRQGPAIAIFMSGGWFGFSTGSLVAGWWAQTLALQYFWVWALPGLVVSGLVVCSRLHRFEARREKPRPEPAPRGISFGLVLPLAVCIASTNCLLVRFLTIYMVRTFGVEAQGWGGSAVFAIASAGALAAYGWAFLSERLGYGTVIAAMQVLCLPFLYMLLRTRAPQAASLWGIGVGATLGAAFPLCVALARTVRGGASRLRIGLCIGGAWGTGVIGVLLATSYIDRFEKDALQPVASALNVCWVLVGLTAVLAVAVAMAERRNRAG